MRRSRWLGLGVLCAGQLMVDVDDAVMNVALPSIQRSVGVPADRLPWLVSAYLLVFGGCLLLGGRLADRLGCRRMLLGGLVLFVLASVAGAAARNTSMIVLARGGQGLAAALLAPAAMATLLGAFPEPTERARALGVWGAITGGGVAVGLVIGGLVTDLLGWRWVFGLNAVVAMALLVAAPFLVPAQPGLDRRPFDLFGAVTATAGLIALVHGLDTAREYGWTDPVTVGTFGVAAALLTAFTVSQTRRAHPLLPLRLLARRSVALADAAALAVAAGLLGTFYFASLYLQLQLGFSPLRTALGYLPMIVMLAIGATLASTLGPRFGVRPGLIAGSVATGAGLLLLARMAHGGSYRGAVLPALLVTGLGIGLAFVSLTVTAVDGVPDRDRGLASGLYNTSVQLGGGLGLAVLTTVASARTDHLTGGGAPADAAITGGYGWGAVAGAGLVLVGVVLAVLMPAGAGRAAPTPSAAGRAAPTPSAAGRAAPASAGAAAPVPAGRESDA